MVASSEPDPARRLNWFSTRLKILIFIESEGAVDTDLVVHVLRAADRDDAFRRALELGATHNTSYKNLAGETLEWRFAEVLPLDDIGNAPTLTDGRSIASSQASGLCRSIRASAPKTPIRGRLRFHPHVE